MQEFSPKDESYNLATATNQGEISWQRNFRVRTSCPVSIGNFPYDVQKCPLMFASLDNSNTFLRLRTQRWNRINGVDEDQRYVKPKNTEKFEGQGFENYDNLLPVLSLNQKKGPTYLQKVL